jgi:uncharacterized damage-inducible protein DinB
MNEQIQLLKWMLEDVRKVTLAGVSHLSKEQLFQAPIEGESSIGSYLMHLGECDLSWQEILSGKEQPSDLKKRCYFDKWFDVPDPEPPKDPLEVKEYIETIAATRKNFLEYISTLEDTELENEVTIQRKSGERKLKKKWIIYHIIEHEAHHRGQMFMLIRKAGWNNK